MEDNSNSKKRKSPDYTEKLPPAEIKNKDQPLAIVCIDEEGDFDTYICDDVKKIPAQLWPIIGHLDCRFSRHTSAVAMACFREVACAPNLLEWVTFRENAYREINPEYKEGDLVKCMNLHLFKPMRKERFAVKTAETQHTIILGFGWA
jgi:hypothetical protein